MNSFTSFLPEIFDYFRDAESRAGLRQRTISLGGRQIGLAYSSEILETSLFKPFEHLESVRDNAAQTFQIFACDGNVLNRNLPGWAQMEELSAEDKKLLMYNKGHVHALYSADSQVFSLVDTTAGRGWYYLPEAVDIPFYEKAAPMRMLLHWWCETAGLVLVHGAAVGWASNAALIAGRGGTGKSATAMLAAQSGLSFLGDDYVVLENSGAPAVLSAYNSVKFRWEMLDRFPSAGKLSVNDQRVDEKGYFYLHDTHPDSLARKLPLKAVLLPVIERKSKTAFVRVPSSRGLLGLAASSIFQMPGSGKQTLKRLADILKDTPVYQMSLGTDNEEIAQSLKFFLSSEERLGEKRMGHPKVSVIIPVYNGEKFLEEAIKSVLNQEYDNRECIVVDDGSTDGSAAIAKKFGKVVYLRQGNAGVAAARNHGVRDASGEYLAFLDADDIWDRKKLAQQIRYMEENPDIGYSFTKHSLFLAEGLAELPAWVRTGQYEQDMTAYIPSALVVRKSSFEAVGGFNEDYRVGEDSDWFLRARDTGIKLGIVEEVLLYKRVHDRCLSSQTQLSRMNLLKSVKASLQRARSADRVSVIVPVYNGEKYLREALDSVLNQSVRPFEVLVIDDGSTDTTSDIARQYGERIRYVARNNKGGAAAARNDGIKSATGDYIAFLDADDYWDKKKLELQLREIKKQGAANMVFGMSAQFYSPETGEDFRQRYQCPDQPTKGAHPGTLLMRRENFLKIGLFSTEYQTGEFIEWYQRAQEAGLTSAFLPDVLMHRRIHPLNHGIVQKLQADDYARIVKEMLLRRRKKDPDG